MSQKNLFLQKRNLPKHIVMKPTPRNSKRKSWIDKDDAGEDENSNIMRSEEAKTGTVVGNQEDGEEFESDQQKEVDWSGTGDTSQALEEKEDTEEEEEQLNNNLETVKLETPMTKSDTPEEKVTSEPLPRKNKFSIAAAALLEAVAKKPAASCGCIEVFLEGEERCKENCLNRR